MFVVLGLAVVLLGLLLAGGQLVAANYKGATFKCLVEGPSSSLAEVSERSDIVTGHPALWPLGRACDWKRSDGAGTITTYSGSWPGTVESLVLLIGGAVLTLTPRRQQPRTV